MSAFVATAPTATGPTDPVRNDGWFPDLSLSTFRDLARLDGTVTDARLRDALRAAMLETNHILVEFKIAHAQASDLAAVESDQLDDQSRLVLLYQRAVHSAAKASLIEKYRDYDSTDASLRRAVDLDAGIDEQRRNARWAISELLGRPHTTVELI